MKTLLFATSWAGAGARVERWVEHHAGLPYPCEVVLAVISDGTPPEWPDGAYERVSLEPRLGRPAHLDYPGWWRSFSHAAGLARALGCRRIWHVESDFRLASRRMVERLASFDSPRDWVALWCHKYGFPETAIQVIGEGRFEEMGLLAGRKDLRGKHAEHVIPFGVIVRDMVGDRHGETRTDPHSISGLDYYGQCPADIDVTFREAVMA